LKKLAKCAAGAVVISSELYADNSTAPAVNAYLTVPDAKAAFVQVLSRLYPTAERRLVGISAQAAVSPTATFGAEVNVHVGACIGEYVSIGNRCEIFPGVVIGAGCRLGCDVTLHPGVVLYPGATIGDRVTIHANSVIGADGFGYHLSNGRHVKIPHVGTVRIEDDVEIGACTTIDRAMLGETVIGAGTKLDNLVMIAHNCQLGRHNILVAQVAFAGSVTTGDYVVCAGQVGIADHVHLGDRCVIGSKSGANKDVPPGETYLGLPGQPAVEAIKAAMALKKLPELRKQFRALEQQVEQLTARLDELTGSAEWKSAA
jgi:UDP-3-O-[3-hydroxymyristoyl] glucosamine N-acyltransferase